MKEFFQVRGLAGGSQVALDLVVEGGQAGGVLLLEDHVGEGGGDPLGVLELGDVAFGGVGHGLAGIEQDVGEEVGFLLVLLEVVLVGLGPDFPVDVADVVALRVLAVLGELDGEAVVGALVEAGDEALDDQAGLEVESFEASEHLRI